MHEKGTNQAWRGHETGNPGWGVRVELDSPWHAMPRAGDQPKQLRAREHEVEYLRDEEQQERLGEMGLDAHDSESHSCHVAECVPGEGACGVPRPNQAKVRSPKSKCRGNMISIIKFAF